MIPPLSLFREAAATARSQPVASALAALMVAGMVVAVMLTTGRTVAAEQNVLGSIDSAGTRSITVRAEASAGLTSDVLQRLQSISGIEWMGALSGAIDATNALVPEGTRAPVRLAYGDQYARLGIPPFQAMPNEMAYASAEAMGQFGLEDDSGAVTLTSGESYAVGGLLTVPDYLSHLQPLTIVPQRDVGSQPITVLTVVAERPELVAPLSDTVLSLLAVDDATKVTVQTSEALAQLRAVVEGQLGSSSRGLVAALLVLTGTLVALLLYGLVMMRRKDFGRRRALGASRGLIVALLLAQTGLLALIGVVVGIAISSGILVATGAALPSLEFTAALGVLALSTALVAASIPAIIASRREPIRELRVP